MIAAIPLAVVVVAAVLGLAAERRAALVVGTAVIAVAGMAAAAITAALTGPTTGAAQAFCMALVVLASAIGGTGLVPLLFDIPTLFDGDRTRHDDDGPPTDDASGDQDAHPTTPLRGGRVIGVLERIAVTVTVLAGWPEGVAVVLAVKGLARYPEIRDQHAGEQFIIGTFGSVLWAAAAAGVGRLIVT